MLEFAVTQKGMDETKAKWVLAVQGNKLLLIEQDRSLKWYPMDECKFAKLISPDAPRPVLPVAPQQQSLVVPGGLQGRGNGRN